MCAHTALASGPGRFLEWKNGLVQSVHACAKNYVKYNIISIRGDEIYG